MTTKNYKIDMIGKRFGRLTVISYAERPKNVKYGGAWWLCQCDCGAQKVISGTRLRNGDIKSCGCLHKEMIRNGMAATHRLSNSRLYGIYKDMSRRCYNPRNKSYQEYGGRGISVCDEWRGNNNFLNFYQWAMSHGYDDNLTLDRINVNGNYCPENCRWADIYTQANNKRNNVNITIDGITKTRAEWARIYAINYHTVCSRMNKGVSPVTAITAPVIQTPKEEERFEKYAAQQSLFHE